MKTLILLVIVCSIIACAQGNFEESGGGGRHFGECMADKVGCYKSHYHGHRLFKDLLLTNRDVTSPKFTGELLDWTNWKTWKRSINRLVCQCYYKAKANHYKYFSIEFFGECWGIKLPNVHQVYYKGGHSNNCYQNLYIPNKACNPHNLKFACAGAAWSMYVYIVH